MTPEELTIIAIKIPDDVDRAASLEFHRWAMTHTHVASTRLHLSPDTLVMLSPEQDELIASCFGILREFSRARAIVAVSDGALVLEHEGEHYTIPNTGPGTTGQGKALKSILHGDPSLKIYTGAFTPAGVRTAAEIADGFFPVWMNPERFDIFQEALTEGFAQAGGGKGLDDFDIMPFVTVCLGDDLEACRLTVKKNLALYVGGMGARGKNFYNDYTHRLGHEDAAAKIQNLFLDGKHKDAAMAVPDEYVDQVALVGPKERIIERLSVWREASAKGHVSAILLGGASLDAVRLIAEEVL